MNEANWFTNETTKLLAENLAQRSRLDELERENAELREKFATIPDDVWSKADLVKQIHQALAERDDADRKNAALREILINADELERYNGSDGRRQWGKCSTWLHPDDAVITVSAKAFDAIRKEAQS